MSMSWLWRFYSNGLVLLKALFILIFMAPLRLSSLNINGGCDAMKRASLFDYIMMKSAGVVFLQETHTDVNNQIQWLNEWKGQVILSHGTSVSAGVAILLAPNYKEQPCSVFDIVSGRLLRVDVTIHGIDFSFVNVYAPNIGSDRVSFFEKLKIALSHIPFDRTIVLAGDFNCTLNHTLDRNHEEPHSKSADVLQSLIIHHSLVDVWRESFPQTRQYTWMKVNRNMVSGARLDRIYVQKSKRSHFYKSCIVPTALSDHHFISTDITTAESTSKHAYWKFNSRLLLDHNFVHSFTYFWEIWREKKTQYKSLSQWWDIGKIQIKLFCQQYTGYFKNSLANEMAQLEQEILQLNFEGDIVDSVETLERNKFLLRNLLKEKAQEKLVRARFTTFNNMDAPTSFFFGMEKKVVDKKILSCLKRPDGKRIIDAHGIISHALSFYEELYSAEPCNEEMADVLLQDLPHFSDQEKSMMDKLLTFDELSTAVQEMSSGKTPGLDGLNTEFYKQFWPIIGEDLFAVFIESLKRGTLPMSLRRAVVTLLPKKGDLEDIRCWRPVSLLGVDYKILSKCLTNRIKLYISSIIHADQSYCIPRRSIFDNIFLIRDLISFAILSRCWFSFFGPRESI